MASHPSTQYDRQLKAVFNATVAEIGEQVSTVTPKLVVISYTPTTQGRKRK